MSKGLPPPLIPSPLFAAAAVDVVDFGVVAVVFVDVDWDVETCDWIVVGVVFVFVFVSDIDAEEEEE